MSTVDETRGFIVKALCSQALSDHLGDVRDSEEYLWAALGVPALPYDHPAWSSDSAFRITKARLEAAGIPLPDHLAGDDDDDD
jgi:hypothetical protein